MLDKLKSERLVLDWKKTQAKRAAVRIEIEEALDVGLPDPTYDKPLYESKVQAVFEHIFSAYQGAGVSIYAEAA